MEALLLSYFLIIGSAMMVDATAATTTTTTRSSTNHPPIHSKFLSHLHCPYAQTWLRVGPERASIEFGLQFNEEDERRLGSKKKQSENKSTTTASRKSRGLFGVPDPSLPPDSATSKGTCTFTNAFTNTETCTQYHGESWTNTVDMETYCATASDNTGIYTSDMACTTDTTNLAGWCAIDVNGDGTKGVFTLLSLSPMADCAGNEMACTTWVAGGVFIPDGECSATSAGEEGGEDDEDAIIVDALATIMANPIMGSCTYTYTISNGTSCFEFRGEEWTIEDMTNRCAVSGGMGASESDESDAPATATTTTTTTNTTGGGVLSTTAGVGCTISKEEDALMVAGYCDETIDVGKHEVTLMIITDGADCTANELVCTAFKGGVFGSDSACGGGGANTTSSSTTTDDVNEALSSENINEDDEVASSLSQLDIPGANDDETLTTGEEEEDDDDNTNKCQIAPGAIGSAHQAGYSKGYSTSCPNTPGEGETFSTMIILCKMKAIYNTSICNNTPNM
jgi:hypothetical protein